MEVTPLLRGQSFQLMAKYGDSELLVMEPSGQFYSTYGGYESLLTQESEKLPSVLSKVDLPIVFNPETVIFSRNNFILYLTSEKEMVVVDLVSKGGPKVIGRVSKIFSGRIATINVLKHSPDEIQFYLISIMGKFSLYSLKLSPEGPVSQPHLIQKNELKIKSDSIIYKSLVYSRSDLSKYIVIFTMNILEDGHMHVFSVDL